MAGFAGYDRGVDQAVIELPSTTIGNIKAKSRDAVAITTIDGCQIDSYHRGMASRWVTNIVGGRYAMTSIAPRSDNGGVGVIGEGALETYRRMTANALSVGIRMVARRDVGSRGRFADGRITIVAI